MQRAALELYSERGFEQTTVADIAERAGVTERTFFRHFADKREVLFDGSAALQQAVVDAIADAPDDASPVDVATAGMLACAGVLDAHRDYPRRRAQVIADNQDLQERELLKMATLSTAVSAALRDRGVAALAADLAAEVGVTIFKVGFDRWVGGDDGADLAECMRIALGELRAVTASSAG